MFKRGDIVRHIPSGQLAEFAAYDADTLHARVECFTDGGDYVGSRIDRVEAFEPAPDAGLKTPSWFRQQLAAAQEARQRAEAACAALRMALAQIEQGAGGLSEPGEGEVSS